MSLADVHPDLLAPVSREVLRSRRKREIRARSVSVKRLTVRETLLGRTLYPAEELDENAAARPKTRADCVGHEGPCPWISCVHHLYLDVLPRTGAIKLNFPDLDPDELRNSCALDVADRGGETLEEVGAIMNLTRERIRQVEVEGLARVKIEAESGALGEYSDGGSAGKRKLPVVSAPTMSALAPRAVPVAPEIAKPLAPPQARASEALAPAMPAVPIAPPPVGIGRGARRSPNSTLSRVNAYVVEHPGVDARTVATALQMPHRIAAKALYHGMADGRVQRLGTHGKSVFVPGPNAMDSRVERPRAAGSKMVIAQISLTAAEDLHSMCAIRGATISQIVEWLIAQYGSREVA